MENIRSSTVNSSNRRIIALVLILTIIILILCLWFYRPLKAFSCTGNPPASEKASNDIFMDNQIIITGPQASVQAIVSNPQLKLGLTLLEDCDLGYLGERSAPQPATLPTANQVKEPTNTLFANPALTEDQRNSLVLRLYQTDGSRLVEDVIRDINRIGHGDLEHPQYVYADPNYLTDPLQNGSCGNPFSGGGSPFSGGGSAYAGYYPTPPAPALSVNDFLHQWAFLDTTAMPGGIALPATFGSSSSDKANVAVFDTSPWSQTTLNITVSLPDNSTFDLEVTNEVQTTVVVNNPPTYNISDHGLFVAGLIHAIAPESKLHLIRVLNDDGCGDLMTIATAIHHYISQMSAARTQPNLKNVVMNFSLGVHVPDQEYRDRNPDVKWNELDDELASLKEAIGNANDLGAIIVAAAGNDSAGLSAPAEPELPAGYEHVLAVAANNDQGQWSCYSNAGDLSAPGGDGGAGENPDGSPNPCVPRASSWNNPADCSLTKSLAIYECKYGVISLSRKAGTNSTEYIYWVGTSFASPLVSGLAAQALDHVQGDREKALCLIRAGASPRGGPIPLSSAVTVDWGIINVTNSLSLAVKQACENMPTSTPQ